VASAFLGRNSRGEGGGQIGGSATLNPAPRRSAGHTSVAESRGTKGRPASTVDGGRCCPPSTARSTASPSDFPSRLMATQAKATCPNTKPPRSIARGEAVRQIRVRYKFLEYVSIPSGHTPLAQRARRRNMRLSVNSCSHICDLRLRCASSRLSTASQTIFLKDCPEELVGRSVTQNQADDGTYLKDQEHNLERILVLLANRHRERANRAAVRTARGH
jgi:hypothetical protein